MKSKIYPDIVAGHNKDVYHLHWSKDNTEMIQVKYGQVKSHTIFFKI